MGTSTGTPLRVVLIEDSPILRDMLRELLGELGVGWWDVVSAEH